MLKFKFAFVAKDQPTLRNNPPKFRAYASQNVTHTRSPKENTFIRLD